ncbi:MAG: ribonuclease D [Actinobacteria bacterium]|nr:ribonuclease D [Actinomycetota bacterium]
MTERLDLPREGTPPLVEDATALAAAVDSLAAGTGPFALDSERASGYRYSQRAYLVQVRRRGSGTHLIDPVALEDLSPLAELLTEDEWVLHAASQDLPCLRELSFRPTALFDTELAGRLLGRPRVGLATMIAEEFSLELAKEHSAADWSVRPLPVGLLNYAALDVELLLELRDRLADHLEEAGKAEWAQQEFDALLDEPTTVPSLEPWRRTSHITDVTSPRGLAVVRELWLARDEVARRLDIAPGRVLPDRVIVAVANRRPLGDHLPDFRELRRREPEAWATAYARALALPASQLPARRGPGRGGLPDPRQWGRVNPPAASRLATVRTTVRALAEERDLPQENLLAPAAQRALAWAVAGYDEAEVRQILHGAGARPWQVDLVAAPAVEALRAAARG